MDHLANPAGVLAWNTDKHYLTELAATGSVVLTTARTRSGRRPTDPRPLGGQARGAPGHVDAGLTSPESSMTMARPGPRGKS